MAEQYQKTQFAILKWVPAVGLCIVLLGWWWWGGGGWGVVLAHYCSFKSQPVNNTFLPVKFKETYQFHGRIFFFFKGGLGYKVVLGERISHDMTQETCVSDCFYI